MTQAEFGAAIGMSSRAVQQWEGERREPQRGALEAIEARFGVRYSPSERVFVRADDRAIWTQTFAFAGGYSPTAEVITYRCKRLL